MIIQWNDELPVDKIISIIAKRIKIDHSLLPMDLNVDIYALELSSLLNNKNKIPEYEFFDILRKSILVCDRNNKFIKKTLLDEINNNINYYYSLPEKDYVIRTTLSINNKAKIRPIIIEDARFSFSFKEDQVYSKTSQKITKEFAQTYSTLYPTNYRPVRILVKNRMISGALTNALEKLDIFRGLCNFLLTNNMRFYFFGIKTDPINRMVASPVFTIHNSNGELADNELFSYQPDYSGCITRLINNDPDDLDKAIDFVRNTIRRLKVHNYKQKIYEFLVGYTRALDSRDYHGSFLKLSCLLEQMTGTRDSYKDVISKKISFLYKDREYHKYINGVLRSFRDSTVHHGLTSECYNEAYLYLLKQYVDKILEYHLLNKNKFGTFQEATNFLNSPRTMNELVIEEKYLKLVKKMYI